MNPASGVDVEDVLPSLLLTTEGALSRNPALGGFLSAAHYPEWAMGHIPPEALDYRRFDILFFGMYCLFGHFSFLQFVSRFCDPQSLVHHRMEP